MHFLVLCNDKQQYESYNFYHSSHITQRHQQYFNKRKVLIMLSQNSACVKNACTCCCMHAELTENTLCGLVVEVLDYGLNNVLEISRSP